MLYGLVILISSINKLSDCYEEIIITFLMAVFAVVLVSCSDTDDLRSSQPQSDRIYFADKNAFEAYLASPTSVELAFPSASASNDVVGQFKEYTDVGKLLNKDLEFQVGDTIYKYYPNSG